MSGDAYIHGTDPAEQSRLGLMNRILNERCLRELALRPGDRVLDVGCGLGGLTRAMARAVGPQGRVVGVERSREQVVAALDAAVAAGEGELVDLRLGDAADLPLRPAERGAFDVAHVRFVLEHVREPLAVVRSLVEAVRPGGRVVLEDEDHDILRVWPEPAGFRAMWRAYIRAYETLGNDPFVGRKLSWLLHEAGASPSRATWIFFGASSGDPIFPTVVANIAGCVESARRELVDGGLLPAKELEAALSDFRAWGGRPDAALWFALAYAEGVRPVSR